MYDGIEYRGFDQSIVEEIAKYSDVPVWNGLTDEFHPTQMLADIMTMYEEFGEVQDRKLVFLGDARNNVANSLMVICSKLGIDFCCCAPSSLFPKQELVKKCREFAKKHGSEILLTEDIDEGLSNASAVYTDVWVSMGEPDEVWESRIKQLMPFQVNKAVMDNAHPDAIFMHCLPAFHDLKTKIGADIGEKFGITAMEVTDEVFESKQSVVFDEAENRMHTIKAVMAATIGQKLSITDMEVTDEVSESKQSVVFDEA